MGKGDIKTRKGKITRGSYGVRRKKKKGVAYVAPEKPATKVAEEKKPAAKKAAPKKTTAKKTTAKKTTTKKTTATKKKAAAKD